MTVRKLTDKRNPPGESAKFYGIFTDHQEILRRLPLYADRKASEEAGRKVARLNELRASGEGLTPELARYVETMPPGMRKRLALWGILSATKVAAGKALGKHIEDWKAALTAKGNTDRHAELVASRAAKAFTACRFVFWSDVSASRLHAHLADLRKARKVARMFRGCRRKRPTSIFKPSSNSVAGWSATGGRRKAR